MATEFVIESKVENIVYLTEKCAFALKDGYRKLSIRPNTYFTSTNIKICEFADKCLASGATIRLYGKKYGAGNYTVIGVEYGGKNATYRSNVFRTFTF